MFFLLSSLAIPSLFLVSHDKLDIKSYYLPINDTLFELHIVWSSDTESHITLIVFEFVSLSLKTRLVMILNMLQEMSNIPR